MTLTTCLSIGQLACVFALWLIAYKALNDREKERERAERNYAIGQSIYEAACMYMRDHGVSEPDTAALSAYVARVLSESPDQPKGDVKNDVQ